LSYPCVWYHSMSGCRLTGFVLRQFAHVTAFQVLAPTRRMYWK